MKVNGFGEALYWLYKGDRIARSGWNGKGMWLAMSPGCPDNPSGTFWSQTVRKWAEANKVATISVRPYIVMYTAQGDIVPWVASQTDLLATDWVIVD